MNPQIIAFREWNRGRVAAVMSDSPDHNRNMTTAVISEDGRGEVARAIVVAAALRERLPNERIVLTMQYDGTPAKRDMAEHAKMCGTIDAYALLMKVPVPMLVDDLKPHCKTIYDAGPLPIGRYEDGRLDGDALGKYRYQYDAHPFARWTLKIANETQWEIAARTSGLPISPLDLALAAPVELPDPLVPGADELPPEGILRNDARMADECHNWEKAEVHSVPRYIVIHFSAGPRAFTKMPPVEVMQAIVEHAERLGVKTVQVGRSHTGDDTLVKGAIDRRNVRLPLTNRLIQGALLCVAPEGFIPYMCYGIGTPCVVLFGPTPVDLYGFPGFVNAMRLTEKGHAACPYGTCFAGGGFAPEENWAENCPIEQYTDEKGKPANPSRPRCHNFVEAEAAAGLVGELLLQRIAEGKPKKENAA